jgi:cobalt-zinc-cadmium resistance protein CzcA
VIGVNVRNRDLQSVVDDIQSIVKNKVEIPEGYRVDYGGQFENLQQARNRLMIAVPIALVLIFLLLYFAFSSTRDALMIYSAIPLSAIGGVLLLWARDMPFSISAGVGFIALFGIAVLNGIVMIEHFKSMDTRFKDIKELIRIGAKERLRPVLLTASAAALGFLPMAVSGSAGAEVQKPLATVVVGGLISATLLTLVVLPVLYQLFKSGKGFNLPKSKSGLLSVLILIGMMGISNTGFAQQKPMKLEEAVQVALTQNFRLQAASKSLDAAQIGIKAGWNLDKTVVSYGYDKNDLAENGIYNRVWGFSQRMAFPSLYMAQKNVLESIAAKQEAELDFEKRKITSEVSKAFVTARHWSQMEDHYVYLDSLYGVFAQASLRKFETGESNYLEKLTAQSKKREIGLKQSEAIANRKIAMEQLRQLLQWKADLVLSEEELDFLPEFSSDLGEHPVMQWYSSARAQSENQVKVEKRKLLPDIELQVFRGTNPGPAAKIYPGVQGGLAIPLFSGAQRSQVRMAEIDLEKIDFETLDYQTQLENRQTQLQLELTQNQEVISYYQAEGKDLADQLIRQAQRSFVEGEIDFLHYVQLLENSRNITMQYLQSRFAYQLIVLEINYLIN